MNPLLLHKWTLLRYNLLSMKYILNNHAGMPDSPFAKVSVDRTIRKRHGWPVALLARMLVCALLLCSSAAALSALPAYANPPGTAQDHRNQAQSAREGAAAADRQAEALRREIRDLDAAAERHAQETARLAPLVRDATNRTAILTREVNDLQAEVNTLTSRIETTQVELDHQRELLNRRAVSTYRGESNALLTMLFSAENLGDLITRAESIRTILQHNSQISADLIRLTRQLESEKAQLDEVLSLAEAKQVEAASAEAELRDLHRQSQAAADNALALQRQRSGMLANTEANAARLRALAQEAENMANALSREFAGSGSGVFAGSMTWPVPGFTRVSSPFGWRTNPISGNRELHTGVDIAGPGINGATVVAAGAGQVVSAGWRGGYGNTIIIDHGNGVITLYAHLQAGGIFVSVGQHVRAGQRIGAVGSTGFSTGPHLHWEVRVNGEARNPLTF